MQIVKTYREMVEYHTISARMSKVTTGIALQINQDLKDNPEWSIHILQYSPRVDNVECTVVFNINSEIEREPEQSLDKALVKENYFPEHMALSKE